jgi:hypothetical protein
MTAIGSTLGDGAGEEPREQQAAPIAITPTQ